MMEAQFRITDPETVGVTLTLTANLHDWRKLRDALWVAGTHLHLHKQLTLMIEDVARTMTSTKWATPYDIGVVEEPVAGPGEDKAP